MSKAFVRLYTPQDQEAVDQLFQSHPMHLPGFDLIYNRQPHFQNLLKCQSEHFETVVAEEENQVIGVTSLSWKQRQLSGQVVTVGYLSDLRMKRTRSASRIWREFYKEILSESFMKKRGIDYYLTAVLADNLTAIKNLTKSKNNSFHYHLVDQPLMVNVLAKKPFSKKTLELPQKISNDQFEFFLKDCRSDLKFSFNEKETSFRNAYWPGFIDQKALIYIKQNQIQAVCCPWSPEAVKQMKVSRPKPYFKLLTMAARLFGFPELKNDQSLTTQYLTSLFFDPHLELVEKYNCLDGFIQNCLSAPDRTHLISFSDRWRLSERKEFKKKYLFQTTRVNLYVVTPKGQVLPAQLLAPGAVDFEMGIV
jgi:hypothetical protein